MEGGHDAAAVEAFDADGLCVHRDVVQVGRDAEEYQHGEKLPRFADEAEGHEGSRIKQGREEQHPVASEAADQIAGQGDVYKRQLLFGGHCPQTPFPQQSPIVERPCSGKVPAIGKMKKRPVLRYGRAGRLFYRGDARRELVVPPPKACGGWMLPFGNDYTLFGGPKVDVLLTDGGGHHAGEQVGSAGEGRDAESGEFGGEALVVERRAFIACLLYTSRCV